MQKFNYFHILDGYRRKFRKLIKVSRITEPQKKKYRVIVYHYEGRSMNQISKDLSIDRKQVKELIEKFKEHESVELDLRSFNKGKQPCFSENQTEQLQDIIRTRAPMNLKQVHDVVVDEMNIECSKITTYRAITELDKFVVPEWQIKLMQAHKNQRMQLCNEHIQKGSTFKNVIFSDESRFCLNRCSQKVFVLNNAPRPVFEKQNPDISIMIWGSICYEGIVHFQVVEGTINSVVYQKVQESCFEEGVPELENKYTRFQQDNAPAHRPKFIQNFIQTKGFFKYNHPPNSPDLNPIEMVWSYLKNQVEKLKPTTYQELEDAIFQFNQYN